MIKTLTTTYEASEFRNIIAECISDTVKKEIAQLITPSEPKKQILTRQETADILNISIPTLRDYTKRGLIIGHRLGITVRYRFEDVQNALIQIRTK
jgi:excisionase family DNA binding protein